ncbi:MAG: NAD(P)/FAD-dependent oxidoreductase [Streptosporangiales bacterium]|nr:NAD(P)/FAD-dependent oxidoreductase [Streptosporangiales bacterium]
MAAEPTFLVVGASLAGAKAAERMRKGGFDGRLVLVGEEDERPYERPPLSKGYLLGNEARDEGFVHAASWYEENSVELLLGQRATALDAGAHEVELADGTRLGYQKLLLATGASPRRLDIPGAELDNVLYLRSRADSDRLAAALDAGGRVVVVGAGWIGLETAVAARARDCQVTVVEPQPAPLLGALGPEVGGFFTELHSAHGVEFLFGQQVQEFRGDGAVTAVVTDAGTEVPADVVIVGVGIRPNTELAEAAGLTVDNGIVVDETLRTSNPDIYAAGDVARSYVPRYGTEIRVEHWANALRGGTSAGRSMIDEQVSYDRPPYFFSDQYDAGLEFAGWFALGSYDRVVFRGEPSTDGFQAFWVAGGKVVAGMHVNRWKDGIKLIEALLKLDQPVDLDRLADEDVPLAELTGG